MEHGQAFLDRWRVRWIIADMSNDEYELEYTTAPHEIKGHVQITRHKERQTHVLSVVTPAGTKPIATFTRTQEHDEGETKYYKTPLGKGNLLAGALLLECIKQRTQRPKK